MSDSLVICTVSTTKVLETGRVVGAIELLEIVSVACNLQGLAIIVLETVRVDEAITLLDMANFAGNSQGFSYRNAGNGKSCWNYQLCG